MISILKVRHNKLLNNYQSSTNLFHIPSLVYEEVDENSSSFFSELISLVSDLKFTQNGRYMVTRDYLTVKVWDLNMDKKPVETYYVHEYLRNKLCSLYENEFIFDKFEISIGGNDK